MRACPRRTRLTFLTNWSKDDDDVVVLTLSSESSSVSGSTSIPVPSTPLDATDASPLDFREFSRVGGRERPGDSELRGSCIGSILKNGMGSTGESDSTDDIVVLLG